MPWTSRIDGTVAFLHWQPEHASGQHPAFDRDAEERPMWSGTVELFRGAPAWDYHPEIHHALKALQLPEAHHPHLAAWKWQIPDYWQGFANVGENRRYLLLTGGRLNWTLVLKFSPGTPGHVYRALARAFNATQEVPHEVSRPKSRAKARKPVKGRDPASAEGHVSGG